MNDRELLPCPRCGSESKIVCSPLGAKVSCLKCWFSTPIMNTFDAAHIAWNTRATDPLLEKMAEALENITQAFRLYENESRSFEKARAALQEYREMKEKPAD